MAGSFMKIVQTASLEDLIAARVSNVKCREFKKILSSFGFEFLSHGNHEKWRHPSYGTDIIFACHEPKAPVHMGALDNLALALNTIAGSDFVTARDVEGMSNNKNLKLYQKKLNELMLSKDEDNSVEEAEPVRDWQYYQNKVKNY
jgi:predicted RNA binding protein YcfA (HicA-like mRNA interferase family)